MFSKSRDINEGILKLDFKEIPKTKWFWYLKSTSHDDGEIEKVMIILYSQIVCIYIYILQTNYS